MGKKILVHPPGPNQTGMRIAERAFKKTLISLETRDSLLDPQVHTHRTMHHPGLHSNLEIGRLDQHPGLWILRGALTQNSQKSLIQSCLASFAKKPNVNNLDTHYHIPEQGLWETASSQPSLVLKVRHHN